jgi:glucosamine 6-phosphate synthetase-like amidotransferase/phosphosugar isomerase protein
MCGIAGVLKSDHAVTFLSHALDLLSTRGYDGYGIALQGSGLVKVGPKDLPLLHTALHKEGIVGVTGIAHNRRPNRI